MNKIWKAISGGELALDKLDNDTFAYLFRVDKQSGIKVGSIKASTKEKAIEIAERNIEYLTTA